MFWAFQKEKQFLATMQTQNVSEIYFPKYEQDNVY